MTLAEAKAAFQGLLLAEVRARAEERLGRPLPESWLGEYERRRNAAFEGSLRPVAGAAALIEALREAGLQICVASQGRRAKTDRSLELTGLDPLLGNEARFSAEQVPRGKPHPDLFLFAAARMGFAPGASVVVEDTPSGVAAARAAGMRVFGYAAETEAGELERNGAQTVTSLAELAPVLIGVG